MVFPNNFKKKFRNSPSILFHFKCNNPVPTISLYIGGHLIRQEVGRHMVTTIQNVTKDMDQILCYASKINILIYKVSKPMEISYF